MIIDQLLHSVSNNAAKARPVDVRIGAHWTIVVLEQDGALRAGLSSTLGGDEGEHRHGGGPSVRNAGRLLAYSAVELAALAHSERLLETSVGFATINALLDVDESRCVDVNAADVIIERGAGRNIAVVGHFPFTGQLRKVAGKLSVLELHPHEGDLPAAMAMEVLPQADVVALTGTSLLNHTFDGLMALCSSDAFVVMLGGTSPLSPLIFETGVDAIAGTHLTEVQGALDAVSQGAGFRQIPGRRLLTMFKENGK